MFLCLSRIFIRHIFNINDSLTIMSYFALRSNPFTYLQLINNYYDHTSNVVQQFPHSIIHITLLRSMNPTPPTPTTNTTPTPNPIPLVVIIHALPMRVILPTMDTCPTLPTIGMILHRNSKPWPINATMPYLHRHRGNHHRILVIVKMRRRDCVGGRIVMSLLV